MFEIKNVDDVQENYQALYAAISSHLDDETDLIANLANISAFLYTSLPDLNWAGFYIKKGNQLVLGPFVGKPACTRIDMGKGVCGTAAQDGKTIVVPDVHAFDGHIACDGETNSEIVLPLFKSGEIFGVLDIDSPIFDRFNEIDADYLEKIATRINQYLNNLK